jgi:iron complex outermembrane receptor protein
MKKFQQNTLKGLACSVSAMALVLSASAAAQDPVAEEETADITEDEADAQPESGSIVVTGSRIKRDTYSSISPLQILTTEAAQDTGQFDPSQLLQRSESAAGQQIDATFQGFVLDNGPGSQTLNLRGLGADRTLLLVNGRRLAPAGVEGAPTNPSINLLPGSLIERYDLLLDGASSVYGSDAVAGVGNIVLRKDFDGPELFVSGNVNPMGGGDDYTASGAWGFNTDRGFFGVGAEYSYRDTIRLNDRDFLRGCDKNYEIDQNGNILTVGVRDNATALSRSGGTIGLSENECTIGGITGRMFIPGTFWGSVYYQGENGNTPIPGYSESTDAFGRDLDANGDGIRDVDFQNVNTNGGAQDAVFVPEQKLYNVMAYGEYTFAGNANITPFFEANYSRAEIFADTTGAYQLFPYVPDNNQFNPCNIAVFGTAGDCAAADNTYLGGFFNRNAGLSLPTQPIVSIRGDRTNVDVVQEMYRGVFGIKGDLPFIAPSWSFETSFSYTRSKGVSQRRGIREDKLAFALGLDPTASYSADGVFDNNGDGIADDYDQNFQPFAFFGDPQVITPCDASALANPSFAMSDLTVGCVPVNLYAPGLIGVDVGELSTQAETDYLFGTRRFDTVYEQTIGSAFVTGDLFSLPAGNVAVVLGAEFRKDKIDSRPDAVASNGLFFGFFSDQGAQGSKETKEVFGELDIPLQAGKPWVEELNLNISGRLTDDQYYGTNGTYSVKAGWRPVSSLLLKMSYGTSFRAPNLRENFLKGQSGFNSIFDPCAVPTDAFNALSGGYNAALDTRDQVILDNCSREGRDPTRVGLDSVPLNTIQTSSVEITTGGSLDIDPETSRSMTAGFAFEETFGAGWDVSIGASYFDIKLKDSIVEPSSQFIVNDCFTRQDGQRSPFCDRIVASNSVDDRLLIQGVNSGFINLNSESVRGVDINATLGKEVTMFGTNVDLGLNVSGNHLMERSSTFIDDVGSKSYVDSAGTFGLPKWTGRATFFADIDRVRLTWQTRYTGPVEQDADGIDPLSDAFGNDPDGNPTGFLGDTCTGGGSANGVVAGDGVYCRDIGFAKAQFLHTVSVRYSADTWTLRAGVTNLFDKAPPLVDGNEVFSIANTAIGNGYDYDGREFFFSLNKSF